MNFAAPLWLWLLAAPALALARAFFSRAQSAGAVPWPAAVRIWVGRSEIRRAPARAARRPVALWLAVALGIVALARPRWGNAEQEVRETSREVLIAMDLSRSMLAEDVKPTRLERARLLVETLLSELRGERVGLLVFAGTAFLQSPLSSDYEVLREFLPELKPSFLPQGGTDYAAMLRAASEAFDAAADSDRFLIVLGDGESLSGDWEALLPDLRARRIRVIALGVGTPQGALVPDGEGGVVKDERGAAVLTRLEPRTLRTLAERTGGLYAEASEWVDLPRLLEATVASGVATEFKEVRTRRQIERFQWFLAPALVLALLSLWREFPVMPTPREIRTLGTAGAPPARLGPLAASARPRAAALAGLARLVVVATFLGAWGTVHGQPTPPSSEPSVVPHPPVLPATPGESGGLAAPGAPPPLDKTVGEIAAKTRPSAADYAALAEATIAHAQAGMQSGKPAGIPMLDDGIAGVDRGERLDPKAADWKMLREALEALKKQQERQQQQQQERNQGGGQDQQQQQQPQKDQQGQNQGSQGQDKQDGGGQEQQSKPEGQGPREGQQGQNGGEQEKQQQNPGKQEDQSPGEPRKSDGGEAPEKQANRPPPTPEASLGDMSATNRPPEKARQPAGAPAQTQKVGGASKDEEMAAASPELAAALQRLDDVRDKDSPARLFMLMDPSRTNLAPASADQGRNW